jgi:PAS domain S-box-containing protein
MSDETAKRTPRPRVLVCEDEIMLAEDIAATLAELGYEVPDTVSSGADAVRAAEELKPDLILMDIKLKGAIDGIEAVERIRGRMDVPVVYLTAYAGNEILERAMKTDPYGYLAKPVGLAELRGAVELALHKHRADKRVRESEEKYRRIFNNIQDVYAETRFDGTIVEISPSIEKFSKYTREELIGASVFDLFESTEQRRTMISLIIKQGSVTDFEADYRDKDGGLIPLTASITTLYDAGGRRSGFCGAFRSVAERKQAEAALKQSEENYRQLIENLDVGVFTSSLNGVFEHVNPAVVQIAGYDCAEDFMAAPAHRLYADKSDRDKMVAQLRDKGFVRGMEMRSLKKDGTPYWISMSAILRKDQTGQPHSIVGIVQDITERKQSADALRRKQQELQTILDSVPAQIFYKDAQNRFVSVNRSWLDAFNVSAEDVHGKSLDAFIPREQAEEFFRDDMEVMTSGRAKRGIVQKIEIAGGPRWFTTDKVPYRDENGNITGVIGFSVEVTDRMKMEEALRESEEAFQSVFENSIDGILFTAPDGRILKANPAACRALDRSEQEICAQGRAGVLDLSDPRIPKALEARRSTGVFKGELRYKRKDGTTFPAEISSRMFKNAQGEWRAATIFRDVAERQKAEEISRQADRFRAVADLTAGVAHNFNNLLQILIGNASLSLIHLQAGDFTDLRERLERIIESSKFGAATVNRLNRYALGKTAGGTDPVEVFDVSAVVRQAVEMTIPWWKTEPEKRGIRISLYSRSTGGCTIRGRKNELFEVVVNLIKNAVEALTSGGDIEIEAAGNDEAVSLRVADTGIGISEENVSRLFTPFFTTRAEVGRGLGLATCQRIVDSHGGIIHVDSVEGKGSCFTITLPYAPPDQRPPETARTKKPAKSLTILAVDDLEETIKMLKGGLGRLGHTVIGALSGREAISVFKAAHIDLVICDLGMPEMNGWQVSKAIMEICSERGTPRPPFIILTGWDDPGLDQGLESGVDAVIHKPVDMPSLLAAIQEGVERGQ